MTMRRENFAGLGYVISRIFCVDYSSDVAFWETRLSLAPPAPRDGGELRSTYFRGRRPTKSTPLR
jgi:hypothetical protein